MAATVDPASLFAMFKNIFVSTLVTENTFVIVRIIFGYCYSSKTCLFDINGEAE
jgi:hypothetical protein